MTDPAAAALAPAVGLLGDSAARDYSEKLRSFCDFASSELRQLITGLGLRDGMRVLDAGCGTGESLGWLWNVVKPGGSVVGIDLASAHIQAAQRYVTEYIQVAQGDLLDAPLEPASFDFIWCVNTLNHFRDPVQAIQKLTSLLRPGGRIALGQSSFIPDMYFAWDSRLERLTNEAVRRYYRERYGLDERDLGSVRALVGMLRAAELRQVSARTILLERISPVDTATERYLLEAIFRNTWGERLRPYLAPNDYAELQRLCDPLHPGYALRRPDFHFLQTFTLATAQI